MSDPAGSVCEDIRAEIRKTLCISIRINELVKEAVYLSRCRKEGKKGSGLNSLPAGELIQRGSGLKLAFLVHKELH